MQTAEQQLDERMQREIQSGFLSAAYLECGWLDKKDPVYHSFHSSSDRRAQLFDLASLTKALVTAPLVHQEMNRLGLAFDSKLRILSHNQRQVGLSEALLDLRIDELLGHFSGLPAWWNFWINRLSSLELPCDRSEISAYIQKVMNRIPLNPSKQETYSDLGYILLGHILEGLKGQDLARQFLELEKSYNFSSSHDLGFPDVLQRPRVDYIATGICKIRERILRGEVHDENCAALGGIAGHAGLFGSGPGLAAWLKTLYAHPAGYEYLQKNEEQRFKTERESLLGLRRGSGQSAKLFCSGQSMGHLGFTGTAFWLELSSRKYAIFLSNRVVSGRISSYITELRQRVFQLLDECLDRK
ncbi:MAG: serine hydrolase [Proteobacteria bacterium]|nr:serine hydrolase [Pseudomonadota bacterium]